MATQSTVDANGTPRPLANYHPNIWGDRFLLLESDSNQLIKGHEEQSRKVKVLVQELKGELNESGQISQQLELIDAIQRLGIEYHFELEIDQALQNIYSNYLDFYKDNNSYLYIIALSFRLLRQHGHKVSCGVFDKFKDDKGDFNASITCDFMGMLEFHEATYLGVQGEHVLDHGRVFTRTHLQSVLQDLSNPIAEQVVHALDYSNRRGLPRLEARRYISIYEQHGSCHEKLLKLAKLDFNILQSLHKRELSDLYSWWKGLDLQKNFWYIRDRPVECYFWISGIYFEPKYSVARKFLFRVISVATILDDTYDAYGTFEELQVFTEAIERWSIACLDSLPLPGYMKVLYRAILEVFQDIEDEMVKQNGAYRASYGKELMKALVRAYFHEAKWREEKYKPTTTEEYMSVATRSCGYTTLIVVSFIGMGDIATKEAFDWVISTPAFMKATLTVCRLTDDIVGHEFEKKREHIRSSVECYMEEHGVSKQESIYEFNNCIEAAWKDINEGFLRPTKIAIPLLYRVLNFTRIIEVMYRKGDWFTHVGPEMQSYIKQLLIDPVPE